MTLRCPICQQVLDPAAFCCPAGHCFPEQDGVRALLRPETAARLADFAAGVAETRRARGLDLPDPALYDQLPCAPARQANSEWRWRCRELALVRAQLPTGRSLRILDVGAYNGWLSHQLATDGHHLTAIDYFTDPFDGLGARRHYSSQWRALQMDLVDLAPLAAPFDVVIMNHGLHFFPDPVAQVRQLLTKVAPGGALLLLGLLFYRAPGRRRRQVEQAQAAYEARFGRPMLFRPAPGYLDWEHRQAMLSLGVTLSPCPGYAIGNLASRLLPFWPWRGYGVWGDGGTGAL